jgi:hypothetical protein
VVDQMTIHDPAGAVDTDVGRVGRRRALDDLLAGVVDVGQPRAVAPQPDHVGPLAGLQGADIRDTAILRLLGDVSLRPSEVCTLHLGDIIWSGDGQVPVQLEVAWVAGSPQRGGLLPTALCPPPGPVDRTVTVRRARNWCRRRGTG